MFVPPWMASLSLSNFILPLGLCQYLSLSYFFVCLSSCPSQLRVLISLPLCFQLGFHIPLLSLLLALRPFFSVSLPLICPAAHVGLSHSASSRFSFPAYFSPRACLRCSSFSLSVLPSAWLYLCGSAHGLESPGFSVKRSPGENHPNFLLEARLLLSSEQLSTSP